MVGVGCVRGAEGREWVTQQSTEEIYTVYTVYHVPTTNPAAVIDGPPSSQLKPNRRSVFLTELVVLAPHSHRTLRRATTAPKDSRRRLCGVHAPSQFAEKRTGHQERNVSLSPARFPPVKMRRVRRESNTAYVAFLGPTQPWTTGDFSAFTLTVASCWWHRSECLSSLLPTLAHPSPHELHNSGWHPFSIFLSIYKIRAW